MNYKRNSKVKIAFDKTAFDLISRRVWIPSDVDGFNPMGNTEKPNTYDSRQRRYYRINAPVVGEPMLLAGFLAQWTIPELDDDLNPLPSINQSRRTRLLSSEGEALNNYVGFPIQLEIYSGVDIETSGGISEGGQTVVCWLGEPVNNNLQEFYLVDYQGEKITAPSNPQQERPHFITDSSSTNSFVDRDNVVKPSTSWIITSPGRYDSSGKQQPTALLDINNAITTNVISGAIKTNAGIVPITFNRDANFFMSVTDSSVVSTLTSDFENPIVQASVHQLIGIVNDRVEAGLENTPLALGAPDILGIFEIPSGSRNYYNLVEFTERSDNSVALRFESVT